MKVSPLSTRSLGFADAELNKKSYDELKDSLTQEKFDLTVRKVVTFATSFAGRAAVAFGGAQVAVGLVLGATVAGPLLLAAAGIAALSVADRMYLATIKTAKNKQALEKEIDTRARAAGGDTGPAEKPGWLKSIKPEKTKGLGFDNKDLNTLSQKELGTAQWRAKLEKNFYNAGVPFFTAIAGLAAGTGNFLAAGVFAFGATLGSDLRKEANIRLDAIKQLQDSRKNGGSPQVKPA